MSVFTPRELPPVHVLLDHPDLAGWRERCGREAVLRAVRAAIDEARARLVRGEPADVDSNQLAVHAIEILRDDRARLRPVLNATGILLHTGLGRAPLAQAAVEAVNAVVRGYCNLEIDLESGERGQRTTGVSELLCRLTGAEASAVVNNNAGATVLALRALAIGREVIVSRGQLIEIGGSFRLPEIFEVSGARLVEVGTTNRTRLSDYERAITPDTAALLRVHPSNFRIVGFTESVDITALAALARSRGLATIDDIGSGALGPASPPQVGGEPTVAEGLSAGADLVLCSGDKLLGGPQCGLLLGSRVAIGKVMNDPLMRALRVDKMTIAALEATLRLALDPAIGCRQIPLWSFLTTSMESLRIRAERLAGSFRERLGLGASVIETEAFLGGGSNPAEPLPTAAVRVVPRGSSEHDFARALRLGDPPVVARIQAGALLLDLRAIDPADDDRLFEAVHKVLLEAPDRESP